MSYYYDSSAAELLLTDFYQSKLFQAWYAQLLRTEKEIRVVSFLTRNHTIVTTISYVTVSGSTYRATKYFRYACDFAEEPKGD